MERHEVRARIESIGIILAIRVSSAKDPRFAATAIHCAGISVAENTATIPDAIGVISDLRRNVPEMLVGAGTLLGAQMAQRCLDAGAQFLTSPGLVLEVVEFAKKKGVAVLPLALTPSEIITARRN